MILIVNNCIVRVLYKNMNYKELEKTGKTGKTGKDWKKLEKTGKNWKKLEKTGKNWKNWKKLEKTGKNWEELEKTGKNWKKTGKKTFLSNSSSKVSSFLPETQLPEEFFTKFLKIANT